MVVLPFHPEGLQPRVPVWFPSKCFMLGACFQWKKHPTVFLVGGFNPIWKICESTWIISPSKGKILKNIRNHHLVFFQPIGCQYCHPNSSPHCLAKVLLHSLRYHEMERTSAAEHFWDAETGGETGCQLLHPGKLTWNPKIEVWKMIFLFN